MKLIYAIILIPFRTIVSVIVILGIGLFGLFIGIKNSIKYRSTTPFKNYLKIIWEAICDGVVFPIWPMIKIFRK